LYFDETNSIEEEAFSLYSVTVDWNFAENYSIQFYGTNLTDKTYTVYGFSYPGVGEFYQLGQGREAGVRLGVEF
jgi:pesticin/yersiniabactin receptor